MIEVYTDRSTVLKHQECARARWFETEVPTGEGFGVVPKAWDPNLLVGATYHDGLRWLLSGEGVDEAWGRARDFHQKALADQGLAPAPGEETGHQEYLKAEGLALSEALIRAYAKVILPQTLERFEILSLEQEELTSLEISQLPDFRVLMGGRTDGIWRERTSGDLYVYSAKTKKEWKVGDDDKNRYDTQGLTETVAVDQRLERWGEIMDKGGSSFAAGFERVGLPRWFRKRWEEGGTPQVMGVVMQFALKGQQAKDKDGIKKHGSPLIRPWMKTTAKGPEWAWKFGWDDALGGGHRLGKGWGRVNIWEAWTVREWIDFLWENNVQELGPGAAIEASFICPEDYMRNEDDKVRRMRQIVFQEERVQEGRDRLIQLDTGPTGPGRLEDVEVILDQYFPMHSDYPNNCGYCEFREACYGPKQYLVNPLAHGGFEPRTSNHAIEVMIRGKGKTREH